MRKCYVYIIVIIASLIAMILSIIKNDFLLTFFAIPSFFVILTLLHELGHAMFCKLNKNIITRIFVCFFCINMKDKKIYFMDYFRFQSYCAFIKKKNNAIIYLGGPIISIVVTSIIGAYVFETKKYEMIFYFIISVLYTIINIIPYGKSDINSYIEERRK